jgi:hypothetical protein
LNKVLDKMEKYFILFTWKYIFFFYVNFSCFLALISQRWEYCHQR